MVVRSPTRVPPGRKNYEKGLSVKPKTLSLSTNVVHLDDIEMCKADTCGECKRVVKEGQNALQCEWCELWFHIECIKVSASEYNRIVLAKTTMWMCVECGLQGMNGECRGE